MDRHALGSARAQHRNDMDYLDLIHLGGLLVVAVFSIESSANQARTFKIRDENAT